MCWQIFIVKNHLKGVKNGLETFIKAIFFAIFVILL